MTQKYNVENELALDTKVRTVLAKYWIPELRDEEKENPAFLAVATEAIEVGVAIFNVFHVVRHGEHSRAIRAIYDLAVGLSANSFWRSSATIVMPVLHNGLNSTLDFQAMLLVRANDPSKAIYDELVLASKHGYLEVFATLAFVLGGQGLVGQSSVSVKQEIMLLME